MFSLFGCILFSFSLHSFSTLYVNMVGGNEVVIHSAPLDSFDQDCYAEKVDQCSLFLKQMEDQNDPQITWEQKRLCW
jgi:hypothetical protein